MVYKCIDECIYNNDNINNNLFMHLFFIIWNDYSSDNKGYWKIYGSFLNVLLFLINTGDFIMQLWQQNKLKQQ